MHFWDLFTFFFFNPPHLLILVSHFGKQNEHLWQHRWRSESTILIFSATIIIINIVVIIIIIINHVPSFTFYYTTNDSWTLFFSSSFLSAFNTFLLLLIHPLMLFPNSKLFTPKACVRRCSTRAFTFRPRHLGTLANVFCNDEWKHILFSLPFLA